MISFADLDEDTKHKIETQIKKNKKQVDLNWSKKLGIFNDMTIFLRCNYATWLPKKEFLKRLVNIRPFLRPMKSNEPFEGLLSASFTKLNEMPTGTDNVEPIVQELHRISTIVAAPDFHKKGFEWFEANANLVGFGLLQCLNHIKMYLVTETCYITAYIIFYLKSKMPYSTSQAIIKGCVDVISLRVIKEEEYIELYRNERNKHDDLELFAGKELPFHFPRFECQSICQEYCAISCAIYTLAFLFQFYQYPKLLLFFQKQIYCRREMTRYYLLKLHFILVKNIDRTLFESFHDWKRLPLKLYTEIGNSPSEKNSTNKKLVNEIIHHLHEISSTKLPAFAVSSFPTFDLFKVNNLESRSNIEKPSTQKASVRLVLKPNTSKIEKETLELTTEHSITEDSDEPFKDNVAFLRKSIQGETHHARISEQVNRALVKKSLVKNQASPTQ